MTREAYVKQVEEAAKHLEEKRLLLEDDVKLYVELARNCDISLDLPIVGGVAARVLHCFRIISVCQIGTLLPAIFAASQQNIAVGVCILGLATNRLR